MEPSQGCWYRLGTICSDAVGGRTHNDAMASTGRFSSEPLASADRPQQSGRIVVGVDASQGSLNALLWALGEARARKIPVHAVLAWQYRPSWVDPGLGSMFPLGYVPDDGGPPHEFADAVASVKMLLDAAVSRPQNPTRRARRIRSESRRRRWKDTPPRCCSRALLDATHWWSALTDTADSSGRCSAPSATISCPTRGAPWWSSPPRSGRRRAEQSRQIMSVSCPGRLA